MNYSDTSLVVLFFVCALVWSYFMSWLYTIFTAIQPEWTLNFHTEVHAMNFVYYMIDEYPLFSLTV